MRPASRLAGAAYARILQWRVSFNITRPYDGCWPWKRVTGCCVLLDDYHGDCRNLAGVTTGDTRIAIIINAPAITCDTPIVSLNPTKPTMNITGSSKLLAAAVRDDPTTGPAVTNNMFGISAVTTDIPRIIHHP